MAFTVTPTSGAGPYVLSASFDNISSIDFVNFSLEIRSANDTESCFLGVATGTNVPSLVANLLNTGESVLSSSVPVGTCNTRSLIIRDLSTDTVIDSQNIYIDNIV